jgi:hypothetical protein
MRTLPPKMVQALASFAPPFSKGVWQHAQVLLAGAILPPGTRRTVSSAPSCDGLCARRLSCLVATLVAALISSASAKLCPNIKPRIWVMAFISTPSAWTGGNNSDDHGNKDYEALL